MLSTVLLQVQLVLLNALYSVFVMNYFDKFVYWFFKHKYEDFIALSTFLTRNFAIEEKLKLAGGADFSNTILIVAKSFKSYQLILFTSILRETFFPT